MDGRNRTMSEKTQEKKNLRTVSLELNPETDTDLLEYLETKPDIQEYLRRLIRADIGKTADSGIESARKAEKEFNAALELLKKVAVSGNEQPTKQQP